jgi:hypothetical protein
MSIKIENVKMKGKSMNYGTPCISSSEPVKPWDDLTEGEKIERLRQMFKGFSEEFSNFRKEFYGGRRVDCVPGGDQIDRMWSALCRLEQHTHGKDGKIKSQEYI